MCLPPLLLISCGSLSLYNWLALLAIGPFLLLCCQKKQPPTTAVVLNTCTDECRRNVHCTQNKSDMLQIRNMMCVFTLQYALWLLVCTRSYLARHRPRIIQHWPNSSSTFTFLFNISLFARAAVNNSWKCLLGERSRNAIYFSLFRNISWKRTTTVMKFNNLHSNTCTELHMTLVSPAVNDLFPSQLSALKQRTNDCNFASFRFH